MSTLRTPSPGGPGPRQNLQNLRQNLLQPAKLYSSRRDDSPEDKTVAVPVLCGELRTEEPTEGTREV